MDPSSSYRLVVHVGAYVKFLDDGTREYCNASNIAKILDRDSTNWNDVLIDISTEIKLSSNHKLRVTYWDKLSHSYEEITSDQKLNCFLPFCSCKRMLELDGCIEPVACAHLSPVAVDEKGKARKLKVIRPSAPADSKTSWRDGIKEMLLQRHTGG
jgi:hypothetical protein